MLTEQVKAHPWSSPGCPGMGSAGAGSAPALPLNGSSVTQHRKRKTSADNEHLIVGCGQVIRFSEKGFFFVIVCVVVGLFFGCCFFLGQSR